MLKSPTKIEYEFSLLNVCSDGVISSMKHDMFWLLLLSLGGLYIFPNVISFIMFSPAMPNRLYSCTKIVVYEHLGCKN